MARRAMLCAKIEFLSDVNKVILTLYIHCWRCIYKSRRANAAVEVNGVPRRMMNSDEKICRPTYPAHICIQRRFTVSVVFRRIAP